MPRFDVSDADALILVDVQNDFCAGGALAVPDGDQIVAPLRQLAGGFRTVVATRDWHPAGHSSFKEQGGPWPPHCVQGSRGAEFHPDLQDARITQVISTGFEQDADGYSGFEGEPDLAAWLHERGIRRVFIGGLATDYCVKATCLAAREHGFEVVLVTDTVRGIDARPGDITAAIQEMLNAGCVCADSGDIT